MIIEPVWIDSERIRLTLDSGTPGQTFWVERAALRVHHQAINWKQSIFKTFILTLAIVMPSSCFYRIRNWYSNQRNKRNRNR
ncbi:hypothetical protein IM676_03120 [Anabaenopsis elenkinii CCIBt3563]|uniref:Uncharacterized protein n=1 Tax=Anabaenopsis elenkinii CCIBt3563 TaxID=2779889 RepID=A0A7S6REA4_9CYAN|nr:hypothetical protein IM676_03120 [Anabaenopsis elenkinii CCIBt3563]